MLISLRNVTVDDGQIKIRFGNILKTTGHGFHEKEVTINAYVPDRRPCIVKIAQASLDKSKQCVEKRGNSLPVFRNHIEQFQERQSEDRYPVLCLMQGFI